MKKKNPLFGSSETTRETPFNFELFYRYGHAHHVSRIPESFLEWFIGFYEGDGSIYSSKTSYSKKRLSFQITQKDKQLIEKLRYTFGYGNISQETRKTGTYWKWTLESKDTIEKIAYLLYGNLVWPDRQRQYIKWIQTGQKQGLFSKITLTNLTFISSEKLISFQNAWLSGFIDAEGCFYAYLKETKSVKTKKATVNLSQKLTLTQKLKTSNQSERIIFDHILNLFEMKSTLYIFQNRTNANLYGRIEIRTIQNQKLLIDYLQRYKLKTQKYISYRRWWRVWLRRTEKIHLTEKGRKRIRRLIHNINKVK